MLPKECTICHTMHNETQGILLKNLEPHIQKSIQKDHPQLTNDSYICFNDVLT